jgi:2-dehydropantoate 2-reductase
MQILVIGAGAVGQVYARHLADAGHDITFFVKPQHAPALADGLPLHRLGHVRHRSVRWRGYHVLSRPEDIAARAWDQVWLCIASDALRSPLAAAVLAGAGRATVVCLQPGPEDVERVRAAVGDPAQVVQGLITFISYQSPLPGRPGPAGIAYFLPPLAPGLFSGTPERVGPVVAALRKGGMQARVVASVEAASGGADALLIPLVAALECNGWVLGGFARTPAFALGRAAALEALAALAARRGSRPGLLQRLLLQRPVSDVVVALAPRVLPLALGPYLEYHFSKVGVQTRQMLESYIAIGERQGLPVARLRELRAALP